MSNHRISLDGQSIECSAPEDADCRRRPGPECEHETWPCDHAVLSGQPCWQIEWTNAVPLQDAYGPLDLVTICPGKEVSLTWDAWEEGVVWEYAPMPHPRRSSRGRKRTRSMLLLTRRPDGL